MRNYNGFQIISFFLWLTILIPLSGAHSAIVPSSIPEVTAKVKIDGILDEKMWANALVLTLDYEVEPGENIAPPVKTEVLLMYDKKFFYIAFRAFDPDPAMIRAYVTDRDNIPNDDYVGIALDTFNDSRYTYNFYCNPHGIQADDVVGMNDTGDQWDGIWDSAGKITKKGYCVEIAIPFTTLRFQGKKGDQIWGIDAVRSYPRSHNHMIGFFPRDRSNNCYMCQAAKFVGFSGAKPGKNMEFSPTLSTGLTQERDPFPAGKFSRKNSSVNPGITARWSFTPNLTLSAAINPDFSQIEADVAQLDINNQFALYYPEKRSFFLEGNSIFMSRFYVIYPRTVIDPEWGIKLTGKEGKNAIGFFTAKDIVTNLIIPSSQNTQLTSLDMNNVSTAFRYRRDIGKSSNLGVVITSREGNNYFNRIFGLDGDLRFTKKDQFWFQLVGSQTHYPAEIVKNYDQPDGKFTGTAFDGLYMHTTKNISMFLHHQNISPNFRADVGFTEQSGIKVYNTGIRYIWRKNPGHWYTTFNLMANVYYMNDYNNQSLLRMYQGQIVYMGPLQSSIKFVTKIGKKSYLGKEFRNNYLELNSQFRPIGNSYFGFSGYYGDQVDFTNTQLGNRLKLNPLIQYNIGKHAYLGLDHVYERLNVEGGRLYSANLSNLRFVYQFNRRTFLRTILQYADYKYNSNLYNNPRDPVYKKLFSQVLFSYKINPGTVLFLGYSDNYNANSAYPLTQRNRTFFLKIGYALVI